MAVKQFQPPNGWPSWRKRCGAKRKQGIGPCQAWAVCGMPTCRMHGSGGAKNRELGQLRYLCWIITGGPQDVPIAMACKVALTAYFDVMIRDNANPMHQMKAALWLTKLIDEQ